MSCRPTDRSAGTGTAFVNELEIRQIGMSRSGNHALINWILRQARGRVCFLNCAEPQTNPFATARPLDDGAVAQANHPDFDLSAERAGAFGRKDLLLFSHEDCFLGPIGRRGPFDIHHDRWVGASRRRVDVLLLRDPFNLLASRLASQSAAGIHAGPPRSASATFFRIWKQHARQFLGLRNHLRPDRVLVNYNRWVTSVAYRREVARALGLRFSDAGRLQVPAVAAGSSFDGRAFDGNAAAMPVLDRWQWLERHPEQLECFDPDAAHLALEIFGDVCAEPFQRLLGELRN